MRHVTIPAPIALENPATGEPLLKVVDGKKPEPATMPWSAFARALFTHPDIGKLDVLAVIDLKKRIVSLEEGQTVALDDEPWAILCQLARQPAGIVPGFVTQVEAFVRAVVDAPTKAPTIEASKSASKKR
jgi:hypothetical protein